MRAAVLLAWRGAAVVAFGATAALAVTLSRPSPVPAALTTVSHEQDVPRCTMARLAVSLAPGAGTAAVLGRSRYPVDFTNTSRTACTLSGYPAVAAYDAFGGGYAQVGNAAGQDGTASARRVVLRPGATAHSDVDLIMAGLPAATCKPVAATGLRVVVPGQAAPSYLKRGVPACSAAGRRGPVYLRVGSIQPGTGDLAITAGSRHAGPG